MNNEKLFFSVIIPTLNEENYLPKLLHNLQYQTYKNFEIIIVDGKSKDRTVSLAKSFQEKIPHLKVLSSDNQNVGFQRNMGAVQAIGDYLVFFDADVQIPRNFLNMVQKVIKSNKYMFLTAYMKPDVPDTKAWLMITISNIGIEIGNLLEKPFVAGFDIIIHKGVFEQIGGFNVKLALSEDHDLAQRCLKAGVRMKILHTPRLIASLRRFRHEGYFTILRRYTQASLYLLLRGPIKKALFDYPMGGQVYRDEGKISPKAAISFERKLLKTVRQIIGV